MPDHVSRETKPAGFDFSGLTEAQRMLLSVGGWAPGTKVIRQPQPGTVRKLIERGLVQAVDVPFAGITVKAYTVPAPVHIAWCQHCAQGARA